jgi:hypothetical protein
MGGDAAFKSSQTHSLVIACEVFALKMDLADTRNCYRDLRKRLLEFVGHSRRLLKHGPITPME